MAIQIERKKRKGKERERERDNCNLSTPAALLSVRHIYYFYINYFPKGQKIREQGQIIMAGEFLCVCHYNKPEMA